MKDRCAYFHCRLGACGGLCLHIAWCGGYVRTVVRRSDRCSTGSPAERQSDFWLTGHNGHLVPCWHFHSWILFWKKSGYRTDSLTTFAKPESILLLRSFVLAKKKGRCAEQSGTMDIRHVNKDRDIATQNKKDFKHQQQTTTQLLITVSTVQYSIV